jgi:hypothetical protein
VTFVKDIIAVLAEGIPVWLRSVFIAMCIVLIGMWALGFNLNNIREVMYLNDIRKNSLLLSKRSAKDNNETVNTSAEELYNRLKKGDVSVIGISVVSFEPEIQPKVLKVIARDGDSDFKRTIVIGSERYLNGGALSLFLANREGINYMSNISNARILKDIGVESVIAMPIIYNNICVGSMVVFLGDNIETVNQERYEYINGCTKIETHQILENLYYNY